MVDDESSEVRYFRNITDAHPPFILFANPRTLGAHRNPLPVAHVRANRSHEFVAFRLKDISTFVDRAFSTRFTVAISHEKITRSKWPPSPANAIKMRPWMT